MLGTRIPDCHASMLLAGIQNGAQPTSRRFGQFNHRSLLETALDAS